MQFGHIWTAYSHWLCAPSVKWAEQGPWEANHNKQLKQLKQHQQLTSWIAIFACPLKAANIKADCPYLLPEVDQVTINDGCMHRWMNSCIQSNGMDHEVQYIINGIDFRLMFQEFFSNFKFSIITCQHQWSVAKLLFVVEFIPIQQQQQQQGITSSCVLTSVFWLTSEVTPPRSDDLTLRYPRELK